MFDLFREIAQSLRNNRGRTMLTGIAVAWGIFMLIVLLGAARGVTNAGLDRMNTMSTNTIDFYGGVTGKPYSGYKEGRVIVFKESDIEPLMHDNDNVSSVEVYASNDTAHIISAKGTIDDGFTAVYPKALTKDRLDIVAGRFINDSDIDQNRRSLVINIRYAGQFFGSPEAAVGKTMESLGLAWTVVGVYDHFWRDQAYVPYTTYKKITGDNDEAYNLTVTVEGLKTEADGDAAEEALRSSLGKQHHFAADDRSAVYVWNHFTDYLESVRAASLLNLAVWIIGIFTLLSGIVGVSNIMFVSVRERTHEIGIRRAIGAKPRSILTQVLSESVAITAIFGYIGIVLGMAVLQVVDLLFGDSEMLKNPTVDISIAVEVTVALIVSGCIAGLFPALKAIKVKPVEALRDE